MTSMLFNRQNLTVSRNYSPFARYRIAFKVLQRFLPSQVLNLIGLVFLVIHRDKQD
jgi:hypothetical protein